MILGSPSGAPPSIPGDLIGDLREAAYAAFTSRTLLRFIQDLSLRPTQFGSEDTIVDEIVDRLLSWAERESRTRDLVNEFIRTSTNTTLQAAAQKVLAAMDSVDVSQGASASQEYVAPRPKRNYRTLTFVVEGESERRIDNGPVLPVTVDRLVLDTARVFNRWRAGRALKRSEEIKVFGLLLFRILFGSLPAASGAHRSADDSAGADRSAEMLQALAKLYRTVQDDENSYLRVVLQFKNEDGLQLAAFPWESIFIPPQVVFLPPQKTGESGEWWPSKGFFLTRTKRVTLARTPETTEQGSPCGPPLCVLVIDARNPTQGAPGASPDEDPDLAWMSQESLAQIQFERLTSPTRSKLESRLNKGGFQIVHFIGQGKEEEEEKEDRLLLGGGDWLNQSQFGDKLRNIRLVILQVAGSAHKYSYEVFFRVAMSQVDRLCAVVALQLEGAACKNFIEEFYRSLLGEEPVEVAIQNGRDKLGEDRGEFGSPIVLLRSWGAILQAQQAGVPATRERLTDLAVRGQAARDVKAGNVLQQVINIKRESQS